MNYLLMFESYKDLNEEWSFLRKEPKYYNFFISLMETDASLTIDKVKEIYSQIQKHRNTIKQNGIDITSLNSFEEIYDMIQDVELIEKLNKFTKLLPKTLRRDIRNNKEQYNKFKNSIISFDYNSYKNIFLKKVSKYRTTDEFFNAMDKYMTINSKSMNKLIKEISEDDGIEVFDIIEDTLIAMVFSKKSSCKFGSTQWCISGSSGSHWESYVPNKLGVQYFVWDFSKKESDPLSQIGVSLYKEGNNRGKYEAFDKSDKPVSIQDFQWSSELISFKSINTSQIKKYFKFSPTSIGKCRNSSDSDIKELYDEIVDEKFKRTLLNENPHSFITAFNDISFLEKEEIYLFLDKYPGYITTNLFKSYLNDNDKLRYLKKAPELIIQLDIGNYIDISGDEFKEILFTFLDRYNDGDTVDDWNNDSSIREFSKLLMYIINIGEKFINDSDFIINIFEENPDYSFRYLSNYLKTDDLEKLNNTYYNNEKEWDKVFNNNNNHIEHTKSFNMLKSYFKNKDTMEQYQENDLYVFNASYIKKEVGVNPKNGKKFYEEVLSVEKFMRILPFNQINVAGMKMRSKFQDNLKTYGIWTIKGLMSEEEMNNQKDEEWFLDMIDRSKFEV